MQKTISLKEYVQVVKGQKQAAIRLGVTQGAISMSLTRQTDVQVTYDTKTLNVISAQKISPFGCCAN